MPLLDLTDHKSDTKVLTNPELLAKRPYEIERAHLVDTSAGAQSNSFIDAYDLAAKTIQDHPQLAIAAASVAVVGAGVLSHSFGALARTATKVGHTISSEIRIGLASLSRESATIEKPTLGTLGNNKRALSSTIDELLAGAAPRSNSVAPKVFGRNDLSPLAEISSPQVGPALKPGVDILPRKTGWQDELLKTIAKPNHDTTGLISSQQREFAEFVAKNSSPLKVIPKSANDSAPRSMNTKAYKVLNDDGSAIFDHTAKYPLPTLDANGRYVATNWIEPGESMFVRGIQTCIDGQGTRKGIYITSNPRMWKGGLEGRSTFEVEIGDPVSIGQWENAVHPSLRIDAIANRVRLLRRVPDEEVNAMPVTRDDHLGYFFQNVLNDSDKLQKLKASLSIAD